MERTVLTEDSGGETVLTEGGCGSEESYIGGGSGEGKSDMEARYFMKRK